MLWRREAEFGSRHLADSRSRQRRPGPVTTGRVPTAVGRTPAALTPRCRAAKAPGTDRHGRAAGADPRCPAGGGRGDPLPTWASWSSSRRHDHPEGDKDDEERRGGAGRHASLLGLASIRHRASGPVELRPSIALALLGALRIGSFLAWGWRRIRPLEETQMATKAHHHSRRSRRRLRRIRKAVCGRWLLERWGLVDGLGDGSWSGHQYQRDVFTDVPAHLRVNGSLGSASARFVCRRRLAPKVASASHSKTAHAMTMMAMRTTLLVICPASPTSSGTRMASGVFTSTGSW